MNNLIIIGSGGYAGVVIDAVLKIGTHNIVGLVDDFLSEGQIEHGHPILGGVSVIEKWRLEDVFIAIGNCRGRFDVWKRLNGYCPRLVSITHPKASIANTAYISNGCFIAAGASVGSNCRIGMMSIVNTNAVLDHDSNVGEFSHIAPNATTGSHVSIGNHCTVGMGATIASRVSIPNECDIMMRGVVEK
jgi:acetyltransferase EpsM